MNSIQTPTLDTRPVRQPLSTARHAPPKIYSDPEIFEIEKDKIFRSNWLMVARVEELAEPGDYMAMRIADEPVLLSRDKAGVLHAFANVCQHRGVEVAFGAGKTDQFKCPYHGWTYKLDGKLLGAPLSSDNVDFDRRNCRLPELALKVWGGNVYINLSKAPQPFEEFIAPYEKDFAYLQQERCRLGTKETVEVDCNWKLVVENLIDIYHVQVLHIGTFGRHFAATGDNVVNGVDGQVTYRYTGAPQVPDGKSLVGAMPWMASYDDSHAHSYRMPPNMHMYARVDMVEHIIVWPLAVNKTQMIVYNLFAAEAHHQPKFEENAKVYGDYIKAILEEDRIMTSSLQLALHSTNYPSGPIVGMETGIHHVVNDYLERMEFATEA